MLKELTKQNIAEAYYLDWCAHYDDIEGFAIAHNMTYAAAQSMVNEGEHVHVQKTKTKWKTHNERNKRDITC